MPDKTSVDPQVALSLALQHETEDIVARLGEGRTVGAHEIIGNLIERNENSYSCAPEPFELRPMLRALSADQNAERMRRIRDARYFEHQRVRDVIDRDLASVTTAVEMLQAVSRMMNKIASRTESQSAKHSIGEAIDTLSRLQVTYANEISEHNKEMKGMVDRY